LEDNSFNPKQSSPLGASTGTNSNDQTVITTKMDDMFGSARYKKLEEASNSSTGQLSYIEGRLKALEDDTK